MLKPFMGRRPRPKQFDLPLRYHDPVKDQSYRERIRFQSALKRKRKKQNSQVVVYAALLFFLVWLITRL